MRGYGHLLALISQASFPLSHEWVCQEGTRIGQGKVTGQMGCRVKWERTVSGRAATHLGPVWTLSASAEFQGLGR